MVAVLPVAVTWKVWGVFEIDDNQGGWLRSGCMTFGRYNTSRDVLSGHPTSLNEKAELKKSRLYGKRKYKESRLAVE